MIVVMLSIALDRFISINIKRCGIPSGSKSQCSKYVAYSKSIISGQNNANFALMFFFLK